MNKKLRGSKGEALAAEYLRKKGYKILAMNYFSRFGEIDLIAEKDGIVVFVEVKLRKNKNFATAGEHVTKSKQEKIIKTALMYLCKFEEQKNSRFDVIEIYYDGNINEINHLENSFS